ncbi:AN1-type zinc finger protein 2A-like [Anthonomus grandis grandis]|uniref:AN1-type zinc finger protein 2A-like n=1 Tax=Anthonomus grandis grandis TaxID=2921223 RepID=UPI002165AE6B|nr:AN1-type zinc finger protein 2A-like [Anthonomus grandis grandis]
MELPHIGQHCRKPDCNKLDFLPIKCDACKMLFCDEHFRYNTHNCQNAYRKDNQVPVCPLCNIPIPVQKGLHPDYVVGVHIDSDCQSDPAKSRRKVFTNKCSYRRCKNKEVIPVICDECKLNFCLKHRHSVDHNCEGKVVRQRWIFEAQQNVSRTIQGEISEDEALARALALSINDSVPTSKKKQEEIDFALARQLQASEGQATVGRNTRGDRCNVS